MTTDATGKVKLGDPVGDPPADTCERSEAIVAGAKLLLAGEHPIVQGLALAELLALWLAGHQVEAEMHEELLTLHVGMVRRLLPHCQAEIEARIEREVH